MNRLDPYRDVAAILSEKGLDEATMLFWLARPNDFLWGRTPAVLIREVPQMVIAAARKMPPAPTVGK